MSVEISVVVPVMNEEDNVLILVREIVDALQGENFEVIFVDDCSSDRTPDIIKSAMSDIPMFRGLRHENNCGQSSAIRSGVHSARGNLVVILDGDGQNDPADIPALLTAFRDPAAPGSLGMVAGERRRRKDSLAKKFASRTGNRIRRWLLKDGAVDAGCGLKVLSRDLFLKLPYFDHMHRFMSSLVQRQGLEVHFVKVNHRPRVHGDSKYGNWGRLKVSIGDLIGVMWLQRRCRLPSKVDEL